VHTHALRGAKVLNYIYQLMILPIVDRSGCTGK
jgi:hypothetical protein